LLHRTQVPLVKKEDANRVLFDFGRAAFGTVEVAVPSSPGGQVEIWLGESTTVDGWLDRMPPGTVRARCLSVTGSEDPVRAVIAPDPKNTGPQAVKLPPGVAEVLPFRYCEVQAPPEKVKSAIQVVTEYPFDDSSSYFLCSDEVLNDVYELCKYTIRATTFCGLYVDGDRERIAYEADAYIQQLGHYNVDQEFAIARASQQYLVSHPTWPTEWQFHAVFMAWADYLYTGDAEWLVANYTNLRRKTLAYLANDRGLISTHGLGTSAKKVRSLLGLHNRKGPRDIVDWPAIERDGYEMVPVSTAVNALYYRALLVAANIAQAIGRTGDMKQFRKSAERANAGFKATFYDPGRGLYVDGQGSTNISFHANMFALACGLVPAEAKASVVEFVVAKGMAGSVYAAQYLLEALFEEGRVIDAIQLMTARHPRSWAHMCYDVGSTMTTEAWDVAYKPNQDWNHAWATAPANIVPRYVVGVQPRSPGFETMTLRPNPGPLHWFRARVPTIRGSIDVDLRTSSNGVEIDVAPPGNTPLYVELPKFRSAVQDVTVNGTSVAFDERRGHVLLAEPLILDERYRIRMT
jgi:hypothetical protein